MRTVSVALPLPIRRSFTYRIPDTLPVPLPGSRVRVPFGERVLTGIVVPDASADSDAKAVALRDVLEVLDDEPVCPPELLETATKVAQRFFAATGEVLKSVLPARLPAAGSVRYRITEKGAMAAARAPADERPVLEALADGRSARMAELPPEARPPREVLRSLEERGWIRAVSTEKRTARRPVLAYLPGRLERSEKDALLRRSRRGRAVADWLDSLGRPATAAEIRAATGAGPAVLRTLAAKGVLATFEQTDRGDEREFPSPFSAAASEFVLTPEQTRALDTILGAIRREALPARASPGSHRQREDRDLPARDRRHARPRAGRRLARPRNRADSRLRARVAPPVRRSGGRPALRALGRGARAGVGSRPLGAGPGRHRSALRRFRADRGPRPFRRRRGARLLVQAAREPAVRRARGRGDPGEGQRGGARDGLRHPFDGDVPRGAGRSHGSPDAHVPRRVAAAARCRDRRPPAREGAPGGEGGAALLGAPRRTPAGGVRPGGAGNPPAAPAGLRALSSLPRLRLRLPLHELQRVAHGPRPGTTARLPLLRREAPAPGTLPGVRRRAARSDRRRHRARRGPIRRALSRRAVDDPRPRLRPAPGRRSGGGRLPVGPRALPHRDADGRQGSRLSATSRRSECSRRTRS